MKQCVVVLLFLMMSLETGAIEDRDSLRREVLEDNTQHIDPYGLLRKAAIKKYVKAAKKKKLSKKKPRAINWRSELTGAIALSLIVNLFL